jgi:hypothetical protein
LDDIRIAILPEDDIPLFALAAAVVVVVEDEETSDLLVAPAPAPYKVG